MQYTYLSSCYKCFCHLPVSSCNGCNHKITQTTVLEKCCHLHSSEERGTKLPHFLCTNADNGWLSTGRIPVIIGSKKVIVRKDYCHDESLTVIHHRIQQLFLQCTVVMGKKEFNRSSMCAPFEWNGQLLGADPGRVKWGGGGIYIHAPSSILS